MRGTFRSCCPITSGQRGSSPSSPTKSPRFLEHEVAIRQYLHSQPDFIALCHWNANIDNAWFWRNAQGELECGLMDWGRVGQMNVALAIFGALSGAEIELWNEHLTELLTLFVRRRCEAAEVLHSTLMN